MGRPNISPKGSGDLELEPELSPLSSATLPVAPRATEEPPPPEKVPPLPLLVLFEEEAIDDKQRREEERKEKKKKKRRRRKKKSLNMLVSNELSASQEYGKRLSKCGSQLGG
jgi:hypothetical protein